KYNELLVAVMLDATQIKAHQDASKHPLPADEQKLGKTKGGRNTKLSVAVNLVGLPVSFDLVCGNEHDSLSAVNTLKGLINGSLILADKAYDTNGLRTHILDEGGVPVIPPKANRKDPIFYPKEIGKWRHRVENFFGRIKRFRRISTRYDKLPETYLGFVSLLSLAEWIECDFVHSAYRNEQKQTTPVRCRGGSCVRNLRRRKRGGASGEYRDRIFRIVFRAGIREFGFRYAHCRYQGRVF